MLVDIALTVCWVAYILLCGLTAYHFITLRRSRHDRK